MKQLCMDSAYKYLVIGLYEDKKLVKGIAKEAFKRQSETIFVELNALLKEAGWTYREIDEVVITKGPGSYTGIRIAMTIAKVLCTQTKAACYTISTMALYAGSQKANVILDARGNRAYVARVDQGTCVQGPMILPLEQIETWLEEESGLLLGDGSLIGREAQPVDFLENFVQAQWEKVDNVHALVPDYLKESDAYKV
ncbi:MAG: tRNA (adenosine(37)-N6)-threonylcarbamoyltransferase complex dimerization subunit type 1 TsaB [Erysipelotrichaceae bacterium]|nr:tRNA (adenosine(37)-N6)-threonylcarbamoyltransferase complex dimerization subunit type 1 TsaB [Erysipelotrichaceae bacterium]